MNRLYRGKYPRHIVFKCLFDGNRIQQCIDSKLWRKYRTLRGYEYTRYQGGRQTSNLVTSSAVYTPTSSLVFEGRYSRGFLTKKRQLFYSHSNQIFVVAQRTPLFLATTGANSITVKDISVRESYEFSGTYIFSPGGRHELRAVIKDIPFSTTSNQETMLSVESHSATEHRSPH